MDYNRAVAENQADLEGRFDARFEQRVTQRWANYEKYIDRDKQQAFQAELDIATSIFEQQIAAPMVEMYLAWMKSKALLDYLDSHFDPDNVASGALFTQAVMDCVRYMQDKPGVSAWLVEQLSQLSITSNNILLRAIVINNAQLQQEISRVLVSAKHDYSAIPWDKLADHYKRIADNSLTKVQFMLEGYLNAISSAMAGVLIKVGDRLFPVLIAQAASCRMGLKTVIGTATRKDFISAIVEQLAKMTDLEGRVSASRLRHYVDKEVQKMEREGVSMVGTIEKKAIVLIDIEEARKLQSMDKVARAKEATKTLSSADEVSKALFPPHWRNKLALAKGMSAKNLAHDAGQSLPFLGCILAMSLQIGAITTTAEALREGQPQSNEKITKLLADSIGAAGILLDMAERAIFKFKFVRLTPLVHLQKVTIAGVGLQDALVRGGRVCAAAGYVAVAWDVYHGIDEFQKGNIGLSIAYSVSAGAGATLVIATMSPKLALLLGMTGFAIAIGFVVGAAIYIIWHSDDNIQKWLAATLWRKIPEGDSDAPAIWPTMRMEMSQLQKIMGAIK